MAGIAGRLILLVVSASFLILGMVVYHRASDRVWNRLFAVHALSAGAWILSNFLIDLSRTPAEAALWLRLSHPLAALAVCTCVDFAWVFPERITPAARPHRIVLYLVGAVFGSLGLHPDLFKSLTLDHGLVNIQYGWPLALFGLFTMGGLGYANYLFLRKAFHLTGLRRVQVIYVLAGMAAGQSVAVVSIIIIPLVWHSTVASYYGAAGYVFIIAAMAHAIAKYHIVRPQVALLRAAAYTLTVVAVTAIIFAAALVLGGMVPGRDAAILTTILVGGVAVGTAIAPLHSLLRGRLERRMAGPPASASGLQTEIETVLRNLQAEDILNIVCDRVMEELRPARMCIMLRDPISGDFLARVQRRDPYGTGPPAPALPRLPQRHLLVRALRERRQLLDRDEVFRFAAEREAYAITRAMDALGMQMLAPLQWEEALIGLVYVGEKCSGDIYEEQEKQRLAAIIAPVSLALQNAQSYAEMAQMQEFSENILRDMEGGVIVVDSDGRVVRYNPAAAQILGLPAEQVLGQSLLVLPLRIRAELTYALMGRETHSLDRVTIERADGAAVPVACAVSTLKSSSAGPAGALAVIHDLTLVQELEREREEAERLSMIRVLAAGMAHEIRNPLVAIQTFADLLPLKWEDAEFRETFMVTAQAEIQRIVGLVSELLMLSKPAGAVSKPVNIAEVCEGVVRTLSARAESGGVRLSLELSPLTGRPPGDANRLTQALQNLVGNALDAEPVGGEVHLIAEQTPGGNGKGRVVLRVANPHSVISAADQEEIFKPFYSRKEGGTGLGLAICQTIVQEHRGTIDVSSSPSRGTEFTIRLPAGGQEPGADPTEAE
jgi:PAS domain S-box-containing protein